MILEEDEEEEEEEERKIERILVMEVKFSLINYINIYILDWIGLDWIWIEFVRRY